MDLEPLDSEDRPEKKPGMTSTGKLVVGCFVAVPVLFFGGCGVLMLIGSNSDDDTVSEYEVERQCERWVEDELRAPSTAEFSNEQVTGGPTEWTVTGSVDAENAFGAQVRAEWTCEIRLDGDTWRGGVTVDG